MPKLARLLVLLILLPAAVLPQPARSGKKRLLIIDKTMRPWQLMTGIAEPWFRAGCEVDYRQLFPYLTQDDVNRYDIVLLLGGKTPLLPGAALTRGDIDLLKQFYTRGKGIVLGFPAFAGRDGANDRAAMNQVLRELRVQVQIGEAAVQDAAHTYLTTTGRKIIVKRRAGWSYAKPQDLAFGTVAPLQIFENARVEIFAETYPSAFFRKKSLSYNGAFPAGLIAASDGAILLLPTSALGISGASREPGNTPFLQPGLLAGTRDFLQGVAARFLHIISGAPLALTPVQPYSAIPAIAKTPAAGLPALPHVPQHKRFPVRTITFTGAHFPDPDFTALQNAAYLQRLAGTPVSGLLQPELKILSGRIRGITAGSQIILPDKSPTQLATMASFMKQADLSIFWGAASPQVLTSAASPAVKKQTLSLWERTATELQNKKRFWFPGLDFRDLPAGYRKPLGANGMVEDIPAPFDRQFWWEQVLEPAQKLAAFGQQHEAAVRGLFLDLEFYSSSATRTYSMGHDFSDSAFTFFLAATDGILAATLQQQAAEIPPQERFAFLLRHGLIRLYYQTLEDEAEHFAQTLRRHVEKVLPNVIWGVYLHHLPASWHARGFLRGLSRADNPVILVTAAAQALPYINALREDEIYILHCLAIDLRIYKIEAFPALFKHIRGNHHGFWLNSLEAILAPAGVRTASGLSAPQELARVLKKAQARSE